MQLTQQQVDQMKAKGLDDQTIAELARKKGYALPDNRSTGDKVDTALNKVGNAVNNVFAGKQVGQAIGTAVGYGIEKVKGIFGGQDNSAFYDTSAPSPLQVAGDVAKGAVQVAGSKLPIATSVPGKVAQFGLLGAGQGGANAVAEGKDAGQVAHDTISEGIKGALTGLTFGVLEKGAKAATGAIAKGGEKIQTGVIRPTDADMKDGFKLDTVKEFDLGGSLQDTFKKTNAHMEELTKELNAKHGASKVPIDMNDVYENTVKKLTGDKFENFGTNNAMDSAIEKLRNEIVTTVGENGITTIPQAQIIKRSAGHFGAWQYGNTDPEAKASERVYNAFYHELKNAIEQASPEGVREINQKLSKLIPVMNAVIRRIPVAERNRGLSLTDMITLTGSVLEPRALALTALNFAQKSGKVGNMLSKVGDLGQPTLQATEQVAQSVQTH